MKLRAALFFFVHSPVFVIPTTSCGGKRRTKTRTRMKTKTQMTQGLPKCNKKQNSRVEWSGMKIRKRQVAVYHIHICLPHISRVIIYDIWYIIKVSKRWSGCLELKGFFQSFPSSHSCMWIMNSWQSTVLWMSGPVWLLVLLSIFQAVSASRSVLFHILKT